MRVELLYWDGDPDYMAARQNLVEVLTEDAFETPIQMISVNSEADAQLLDFRGSPTIRIDGLDIAELAEGDEPATPATSDQPTTRLRRRIYPTERGDGDSHVPPKSLIRAAVERARGWGHARRE